MNHILIPAEKEPDCLKILRSNPIHTYGDLKDPCKDQVIGQLSELQNELCAYCERKFSRPELPNKPELALVPYIEHYLPQKKVPEHQLSWNNFLAVCSGKFYKTINDRKAGIKTDFCSHKRGDKSLNIDPRINEHIQTLYYDENHRICSTLFDDELNSILNLNFDEICRERADSFMDFDSTFIDEGERMILSRKEIIIKAISEVENEHPAYKNFILYRYYSQLKEIEKTPSI